MLKLNCRIKTYNPMPSHNCSSIIQLFVWTKNQRRVISLCAFQIHATQEFKTATYSSIAGKSFHCSTHILHKMLSHSSLWLSPVTCHICIQDILEIEFYSEIYVWAIITLHGLISINCPSLEFQYILQILSHNLSIYSKQISLLALIPKMMQKFG